MSIISKSLQRIVLVGAVASALSISQPALADAPAATLHVQADKPGAAISPILDGVFFEDINFAADGGLYPERIKNRSFEFTDPLMAWRKTERGGAVGGLGISDASPLNANNPHYLHITVESPGEGFGLTNEGYRGMGVTKGAKFTFSVYARSDSPENQKLAIELIDPRNQKIGYAELTGFTKEWKTLSCEIESSATEPRACLTILDKSPGSLDLDMVSLYPQETFHNRANGLRPDLAQLVADLKPGFMRFPGGCIVEGRELSNRYQWKTTIGDVSERRTIMNRWNTEFMNRATPDYFESFGLGFFEYFQFCEDIGAKPLPILNCGMACQFNSGELCPVDQLDQYIQDALDLIEFANGPATSTWGAKRAAMGHPAPFNLTMFGVGNEQWGPQYFERYIPFAKAIKSKYPDIQLVSGAGPDPDGKNFDFAWNQLRALHADLVDEHFYRPPEWFLSQVNRYDNYDRTGPKVFAGEFAAHTKRQRNNWEAALAEAALRTGLERNGDIVKMSSYAPLFAHTEAWQWGVNLIWFDNLRSFGTPSYYVQKLFANNLGTNVLPATFDGAKDGLFVVASNQSSTGDIILKIVNTNAAATSLHVNLAGAKLSSSTANLDVIASDDLAVENSLDEPMKLSPKRSQMAVASPDFDYGCPARSLSVIRLHTH
ncbi:MAG TPA: alpha-L-arabinofuranosidase C-terminal domain-containing protein [Tepidisphaeraceae bacterium]|jgi:alpha-N-arabinofuranosidase|nr:alpha-L-arabinofuranosidase C-terminal domain-containing protein [Tepidisphaeraceae bacterium]